jgi:two-component system sensor histidine kinase HydH
LAVAEKRELLARLLARLAHEIRNPLSSLQIHLQLLEEELARDVAPERWESTAGRREFIHTEIRRLENLVTQFLQLAGPSSLELEPMDLALTAQYVHQLLKPEAASRGIDLQLDLAPDLPRVVADANRLKQAMLNLLINALQAAGRNGRAGMRLRRGAAPGEVLIQVWDNGPGVPSPHSETIFEPFFTTKAEGSGLGLWIAQQIAAAHGGSVRVAAAAEGGALFTWVLPVQPAMPAPFHE